MGTEDASLPDMTLLRLFELLYGTHSVTRAAEQLGQSQPTVSIWLGKLRELLHDPLFVRTPAGMQPTPRAEALVGTVRDALACARRLAEAAPEFDPAQAQRRFRICMTDASHVTLLPQMLAHVRAVAPGVRLEAARIEDDWLRRIGPAHFGHINFRGTMRFGIERFAQSLIDDNAGSARQLRLV